MSFLFFVLSLVILGSGVAVVALRNPIHSALCLVVNLMAVAGIFALLEAHFLAAVQIVVYAGAIMVLVIFVIMLLNVKKEENKGSALFLSIVASCFGALFFVLLSSQLGLNFGGLETLEADFLGLGEGVSAAPVGTVKNIGREIFTTYVLPFEAATILIMAAIVGAVMIAKRKRSEV